MTSVISIHMSRRSPGAPRTNGCEDCLRLGTHRGCIYGCA